MVASLSPSDAAKRQELEALLAQPLVGTWKLREYALTPGGLVNDEIRKIVWPKLVGVNIDDDGDDDDEAGEDVKLAEAAAAAATPWTSASMSHTSTSLRGDSRHSASSSPKSIDDDLDDSSSVGSEETSTTLSSRVDVDTIERDVLRCTTHLLPPALLPHLHDGRVRALLRNQQERLAHLINKVLINNDGFWYYQGYHDVSSVFLATLSKAVSLRKDWTHEHDNNDGHLSYAVLSQVSRHFFRDFLHNNFGHLQTTLKLTVFPLLARFDPDLHDLLFEVEIPCSFCLSWILTWFARESGPLTHRVFDACLASHPLFCLYLSVALVTHPYNRSLVLSSEPDFSVIYNLLRTLPKNTFGETDEDDDDTDDWMDDQDDASVWDNHTVDESWLTQKIQERHHQPHQHHHHDEARQGHAMLPVSLEDLIGNAIEYMRLVPPHQLLDSAERYYRIYGNHTMTGNQHVEEVEEEKMSREMQDLLVDVPDIYFFRTNLFKWESLNYQDAGLSCDSMAVVAAGLAEGSLRMKRRKRKQRQRAMLAAVVALLGVGLAYYCGQKRQPQHPSLESAKSHSSLQSLPIKVTADTFNDEMQVVVEVDRQDLVDAHEQAQNAIDESEG